MGAKEHAGALDVEDGVELAVDLAGADGGRVERDIAWNAGASVTLI